MEFILSNSKINRFEKLKKRDTARKPNKLTYKPLIEYGWKYECPECKCAVGVNLHGDDFTQEDNFCPNCGQRLDWNK